MLDFFTTLNALDAHWLEVIRASLTIHASWFSWVILSLADIEPILFGLFLVLFWLYGSSTRQTGPKYVALDLFWHVALAFGVYIIINQVLPVRPRPELYTSLPPLINHLPDNSFPSGHAFFWGASWWALHTLLGRKRITCIFFILGFLCCLARVVAGIHYPGDIIVGFLLGWGVVAICMNLPHGKWYRKYLQEVPVQCMKKCTRL